MENEAVVIIEARVFFHYQHRR